MNGFARMDFRMREDGSVFLLEANANPNLTKDEDLAESAKAVGVQLRRAAHAHREPGALVHARMADVRRMNAARALAASVFAVLALHPGAAEPPTTRDAAQPQIRQLDYFQGTWRCEGWNAAGALGPEHRTQARIVFAADLDGVWLATHWEETRTAENPKPWKLENAFAYDAVRKVFVFVSRDNTGASTNGTSPGWSGDSLVVSGDFSSDGQSYSFRDVYVRRDARTFDFVAEIQSNGAWSKDADTTCIKEN